MGGLLLLYPHYNLFQYIIISPDPHVVRREKGGHSHQRQTRAAQLGAQERTLDRRTNLTVEDQPFLQCEMMSTI